MNVKSISIRRAGDYSSYGKVDPSKPLMATVEVEGAYGKVELSLDANMSRRIVEIIADEIAAAGRATAEAMVASVITLAPSNAKQLA
jgi:hypothetical protein